MGAKNPPNSMTCRRLPQEIRGEHPSEDLDFALASDQPEEVVEAVESRFAVLRSLSDLERELIADARSGWNEPLAEKLRAEARALFAHATS